MRTAAALSRREIERIAEDIWIDYHGANLLWINPIDICAMVSEYFNLTLKYERLSDTGAVMGLTAYRSTNVKLRRNGKVEVLPLPQGTVLVEDWLRRDESQRGRLRFTVAHECAHQIIFRMCDTEAALHFRRWCAGSDAHSMYHLDRAAYWSERKANELAAALLMPIPLMEFLAEAFDLRGVKVYGEYLLAPKERQAFARAAYHVGVSKQALMIRLKQLGIIAHYPEIHNIPGHCIAV